MSKGSPSIRVSKVCAASPEVVYDILADLRSHLRWGGTGQRRDFRLLSLEAPDDPATVGTVFASTGAMPMARKRWEDRSTVTVAARPSTFQFVTAGRAGSSSTSMVAQYTHRYEVAPAGGGSIVTYTMTEEHIANPFLRMALPVIRQLTWRLAIPMFAGRGLRNLVREAQAAAKVDFRPTTEGTTVPATQG
ncbi:MAG: SRPBCC family protein [Candidatus Dormibacteria bacterium]